MTWMGLVSLMFLLVAGVYFATADGSQGSVFVALAVVFLVVGQSSSRRSS